MPCRKVRVSTRPFGRPTSHPAFWIGSDSPIPAELHGRSLLPLVDVEADPSAPGPGYAESIKPLALFDSSMLRTLRRGEWKYIHKLEPELYRVSDDPSELRNLASQHPERVREMRSALSDLVRSQIAAQDSRTDVDEAQRAQLQALGYLGVETPDAFNDADDLRTLRGPDPRAAHADVVIMEHAHGLVFEGKGSEAADELRALHARHPKSEAVRESLLKALFSAEQWKDVATLAGQVLEDDATHLMATEALGTALGHLGRHEDLEAHWRRAAAILPCDAGMSSRHSLVLFEAGREAERVAALEDALERCPENPAAMNDLSYALSTTPEPGLLDGEKALVLARRAVDSIGTDRPDFLDTLACAQARTGDFASALRTSERAIEILRMRRYPAEVIQSFEVHRKSFAAREPVVDAPAASDD